MAKFHVRTTFELPDRDLFVLAGSIVEGEVLADMFVRVPLSESHGVRLLIHSIEYLRRKGGEDVCLCIQAGMDVRKSFRALEIADKTLMVKAEPSDDCF